MQSQRKVFLFVLVLACILQGVFSRTQWTKGVRATRPYPFIASVICDKSSLCGGAVITANWVLTAALCLFDDRNNKKYKNIEVCVGTQLIHHPESETNCETGAMVAVDKILTQLQYNDIEFEPVYRSVDNDIGLLKTVTPLPTEFATPIPLISSKSEINYLGLECKELAWIPGYYRSDTNWVLREARIQLAEADVLNLSTRLGRLIDRESHGKLVTETIMIPDNVFQGSVGMPLVIWYGTYYVQIGISSRKYQQFADFTPTVDYLEWIQANIQENISVIEHKIK